MKALSRFNCLQKSNVSSFDIHVLAQVQLVQSGGAIRPVLVGHPSAAEAAQPTVQAAAVQAVQATAQVAPQAAPQQPQVMVSGCQIILSQGIQ